MNQEKIYPRLLIISVNAWSESKSSGIFFSSHFGAWNKENLSNIYLRDEKIDNKYCSKYFRIAESDIRKSILSKKSLGIEMSHNKESNVTIIKENRIKKPTKFIEFIKRIRPTSILLLRELFWIIGFRNKDKLKAFLEKIKPEIIHMHCSGLIYPHRVLHYCHKITNAKVVIFCGDEIYSYKNFWPLARLYQFFLRIWIKKTVKISDLNYAATPELCDYYLGIFGKTFNVLYKGALIIPPIKKTHKLPLQLVYTGNILWARWQTLSLVAKAIKQISDGRQLFKLEIYTNNALSKKMLSALNTEYSEVKKAVTYEEVKRILSNADIVIHAEGFSKKYNKITKYSFSTKIVDCVQSGSCIMAVGPRELASICFLEHTNAAIIANSYEDICNRLRMIISDSKVIDELPLRMYYSVKDKFDLNLIREDIYNDIIKILD